MEEYYYSILWQNFISVLSFVNLIHLIYSLSYRKSNFTKKTYCCIIFTFVCLFRSVLPRVDAERLCFWNLGSLEILQSAFLGRCCATIAEIAFSYQVTSTWDNILKLYNYNKNKICKICWYLCCYAQILCWIGVIRKNHLFHAFETSLWGISSMLIGINSVSVLINSKNKIHIGQIALRFYSILGILFTIYIFTLDVPMYYNKWIENFEDGINLSFTEGLNDSFKCVVNKSFRLWKREILWMTSYFIGGPFISIKLEEFCDKNLCKKIN